MKEASAGPVAVFGASGFVGRQVLAALASAGRPTRAIARTPPPGGLALDAVHASPQELADALAGCSAVVNIVGIKRPDRTQGFDDVHADFPGRLVEACRLAGVGRLVHVSVASARPDGPHAYHRSKAAGDALVAASGLQWTVLRPSVIWGPGDDMVAHLAKMVRASPVFPIVGRGLTEMEPIHVEDVASAVVAALAAPAAVGRTIDLVGPERLRLRDIIDRVADAMGMPTRILPVPAPLMWPAAALMTRFAKRPLTTTGQLAILREGLTGDGELAREVLGSRPRPFMPDGIRAALPSTARMLVDLRFARARGPPVPWAIPLTAALLGLVAVLVGFRGGFGETWIRLVSCFAVAGLAVGLVGRRLLRDAWRPTPWMVLLGGGIGVGLYAMSWVVASLPGLGSAIDHVFTLQGGHPVWFVLPTLVVAIVAEEVLWRGVLLGGLATRIPPWLAAVVSAVVYSAGHVASGSPLLVAAALGLGLVWGVLFLATRSLTAAIVCHATWEVLAAVLVPVH